MHDDANARAGELELVTFHLGSGQYGLDIMDVREIIRMPELTRAPQSPDFLAGMLNLRGSVLPVIDLRLRMGMPPASRDKRARVVIVGGDEGRCGLMVDAVADVLRLREDEIQLPPSMARGDEAGMVRGVSRLPDDRLLLLLDLAAVLPGALPETMEADRSEGAPRAEVISLDQARETGRRPLRRAA